MKYFVAALVLSVLFTNANCFLNIYPEIKTLDVFEDAGDPLYLTPLIKAGHIEEARNKSAVNFSDFKNILSYSGYFTVNENYNSNLFFWYFPTQSGNANDPVILWLQGGPGMTSLYGLFTENGPFVLKSRDELDIRDIYWNLNHHVIYIDNPVGAGYSFTENDDGYSHDETELANNLHNALTQFFQVFPELQQNEFFATGESYAGKYVPALSNAIHTYNENAKIKINLKGLAIGNGWTDPIHQLRYGMYLYEIGLIDLNTRNEIISKEKQIVSLIEAEKWVEAYEIWADIIFKSDGSIFSNATGFGSFYNYLHSEKDDSDLWSTYVQKTDVRKAIHVGNNKFDNGKTAEGILKSDMLKSVAPLVSKLLDNYRVMIYSGQLDIIVAYPLTLNYLQNLEFSSSDEYKTAERHIWNYVNDVERFIAGYWKKAGHLTEVLVRNAGHMVPTDQPLMAYDLITKFTRNRFN